MWCRGAVLALTLALAGCGLTPLYGAGGAGLALQDRFAVTTPDTTLGYHLRDRLEERFGTGTDLALSVETRTTSATAAFTREGDITRQSLLGAADWSVIEAASGAPVAQGSVQTFTSYSATGSTIGTQTARTDAERRLAVALADLIAADLTLQVIP